MKHKKIKIKEEINELKTEKQQKISTSITFFIANISKINKPLTTLTKKQRTWKISQIKDDLSTDPMYIEK